MINRNNASVPQLLAEIVATFASYFIESFFIRYFSYFNFHFSFCYVYFIVFMFSTFYAHSNNECISIYLIVEFLTKSLSSAIGGLHLLLFSVNRYNQLWPKIT